MKVISSLNVKFATIEFRVTLLKHHASITLALKQWRESSDSSRTLSASQSQDLINSKWTIRSSSPGFIWSSTKLKTTIWSWELPWESLSLLIISSLVQQWSFRPASTLQVENCPESLLFSLGAGIHQETSYSNLERTRCSTSGWRYHSLQEGTNVLPQDLCCLGSGSPLQEKWRPVWSYNNLPERGGRTNHLGRQTSQPAVPVQWRKLNLRNRSKALSWREQPDL